LNNQSSVHLIDLITLMTSERSAFAFFGFISAGAIQIYVFLQWNACNFPQKKLNFVGELEFLLCSAAAFLNGQ